MNSLRDKLLREDGIDPAEVSEPELAWFRTLLAREPTRANRAGWTACISVYMMRMLHRPRLAVLTGSLVILGIGVIVPLLRSQSLYAQALESLRQARTIRAVAYRFREGRPIRESEIRHVRSVGTQIQGRQGDQWIELYDDGRDRYEHVRGNDYAVRKEGQGQLLPRELVEPLRYLQDTQRDRSRDKALEGTVFPCHKREDPNSLSLIWVDGAMRFRRYEEHRRIEGRWQQDELVEISYDEPFELDMPPGVFERQGIRIIEPAQVLETRFSLENAIAREEALGLIFAVHELHRCGEYLILTSSLRPTEESLRDLAAAGHREPGADPTSYGGLDLTSWWQRKTDGSIESRPYGIRTLGHLSHRGTDLYWHALLPRGNWPGQGERLEVCAYVQTDDALRQLRQQNGLEVRAQFRPLLTVGLPATQSDLASVAKDLYDMGQLVTGVSRAAQDLFVSEASGVTLEQFRRRLEGLLTGLRPMGELWDQAGSDLTLQLTDEQGTPVSGAWLASRAEYSNGAIRPERTGPDDGVLISDARGQAIIPGSQFFDRDSSRDSRAIVYAFEPEKRLVACPVVGGDFGRPLSIAMEPAHRVRISFAVPELKDSTGIVIHVDVRMSVRKDFSQNRILIETLRLKTQDRAIEIPLPSGEYLLNCRVIHDGATLTAERHFRLSERARNLDLETIELGKGP